METETIHEGAPEDPRDPATLASYALLAATFTSTVGTALLRKARAGDLPEAVAARDIVLLGVATQKISRILAKDKVMSFVRAPFTGEVEEGDLNEINSTARGRGIRRSVGELLTCPLCVGTWVAGGATLGLLYAPRVTRAAAAVFGVLAVSDLLHAAYAAAASRA